MMHRNRIAPLVVAALITLALPRFAAAESCPPELGPGQLIIDTVFERVVEESLIEVHANIDGYTRTLDFRPDGTTRPEDDLVDTALAELALDRSEVLNLDTSTELIDTVFDTETTTEVEGLDTAIFIGDPNDPRNITVECGTVTITDTFTTIETRQQRLNVTGNLAPGATVIPTPAALPAGLALLGLVALRRRRGRAGH